MQLSRAATFLTGLAVAGATPTGPKQYELPEWDDLEFESPNSIVGGEEIVPGSRPYLVPVVGRYFW
jgi:hypothetical protein